MIVLVVYVRDVGPVEAKCHPPVAAHIHRPRAVADALERMKPKPWKSHVSGFPGDAESRENQPKSVHVLALNPGRRALAEEAPQPLVPERDDRH